MDPQQLTKVDLFKNLSPESRAEIAAEMKLMTIAADTKVVKVGDVAREMFFVLSGTVRIVDSDNHQIRVLQPGTFFGELGLIYNIPRTVSVVAIDEVQLGVLHKVDFDKLRDRYVIGNFARTLYAQPLSRQNSDLDTRTRANSDWESVVDLHLPSTGTNALSRCNSLVTALGNSHIHA